MTKTPEGKVKDEIKKILDQSGAYYFMPPQNGYGRAGIPDFVGCLKGRFFSVEAKAGKGTTTALQDREISKIKAAEGYALVVNEDNLDELVDLIHLIKWSY